MANSYVQGVQDGVSIATGGTKLLAAWVSVGQDGGSSMAVYGQGFSTVGEPVGSEVKISEPATHYRVNPVVSCSDDDSCAVAYASGGSTTLPFKLLVRRVKAGWTPTVPSLEVGTIAYSSAPSHDIEMLPDHTLMVAWAYDDGGGNQEDVYVRRVDAAGVLGPVVRVNQVLPFSQSGPRVAVLSGGKAAIVWSGEKPVGEKDGKNLDLSGKGVFCRLFDVDGTPTTNEFRVNTRWQGEQDQPAVCAAGPDRFAVVWRGNVALEPAVAQSFDVFLQLIESTGAMFGEESSVNGFKDGAQERPACAGLGDQGFVVVYESYLQDWFDDGVYATLFTPDGAKRWGK